MSDCLLFEFEHEKHAVQAPVIATDSVRTLHEEKHMTGSGASQRSRNPECILRSTALRKPTFAELQLDRTKQSPSKESITFCISSSMSKNEISSSDIYIRSPFSFLQTRSSPLKTKRTLCERLSVDRQRKPHHSLEGRFHLHLIVPTVCAT